MDMNFKQLWWLLDSRGLGVSDLKGAQARQAFGCGEQLTGTRVNEWWAETGGQWWVVVARRRCW